MLKKKKENTRTAQYREDEGEVKEEEEGAPSGFSAMGPDDALTTCFASA